MFASRARARALLLGVRPTDHAPLLRGLASRAASPRHYISVGRRHYHQQQHQGEDWEEEARAVKVTVWWDFEKCRLPPRVNPRRLGSHVTAALRHAGIRGPVEITAFGDVTVVQRAVQEALAETGVAFSHIPSSGKEGYDRSFMSDLVYWIARNPPPAHFFLISGDQDFANVLHRLRMSNYNILLSCPDTGSKMLRTAATFMWPWETLVKGDPKPRYLNHPPDGLSCSWYGQYMETGDDLLLKLKNPKPLPRNSKVPKIPLSVVNGIKKVLRFNPQGVSVQNLREELKRINVPINRRVFGFGKLSALLQAMPEVVKFIDALPGDSHRAVVGVSKRSLKSSEQSFNRMDFAQNSIEEERLNDTEGKEQSSRDALSSSSELISGTKKKTVETDVPSSLSDQLFRHQKKAPEFDLAALSEPPSKCVEADTTLAVGSSPTSDALSRDQNNAPAIDVIMQREPSVSRMEADIVADTGTPSSGEQGNTSNRKGFFERILSLWNGSQA